MSVPSLPHILTVGPNSRFQVMDRPVAIPGKCVVCGAVDRPVVDTRWDMQFYGVIYFCIDCLSEVAGIIGMVDGSLLREAEADSAKAFHNYVKEHDLKVVSNEQYVYWADTVSNLHNDITRDRSNINVPVDVQATLPEFNTVKDNGGVVEQESELAIDEGPVSVSASDSDGKPFFTF